MMPAGGFNNRGARGAPNRSQRGSGPGSAGRGASSSSSKSEEKFSTSPTDPKAMQDVTNMHRTGGGRVQKHDKKKWNKGLQFNKASATNSTNSFENERLENAAKRSQRGVATSNNGGYKWPSKQVRFGDATEQKPSTFGKVKKPASTNPFAPLEAIDSSKPTNSSPFGAPTTSNAPSNPFASTKLNAFDTPQPTAPTPSSSFGAFRMASNTSTAAASSWPTPSTSVFGVPSTTQLSTTNSNPFATTTTNTFGAPTVSNATMFQTKQPTFGTPPSSVFGQTQAAATSGPANSFGSFGAGTQKPSAASASGPKNTLGSSGVGSQKPAASFASPASSSLSPVSNVTFKPATDTFQSTFGGNPAFGAPQSGRAWQPVPVVKPSPGSLARRIYDQLNKDRLVVPTLSGLVSADQMATKKRATVLWADFQKHREKVRASLMKANLLDDPDKPKKLKDAIDFKGTCEEMCPDFEVVTRIMDGRYDSAERDTPESKVPNPSKMIKALARSAAGQDAPLPSDIRSAAALRRTIDHLFNTILGERDLETVHGFIWDRTRAVRRDFVFHSSMGPTELVDQVYCLEHITRFHAIALHQMSRDDIDQKGFVEQQEREQLSKSLLSLMHAYEDCKAQGVHCENEIEFKSYYIVFNAERPDILEIVQNWGWEFYGESEEIRIAISLAEAIQNTWDFHGPLNPHSTTEIAQNAYAKFFSIVEDKSVSYTMACFAEMYFNKIRKAILKSILLSYRKQRDQTKDWTPTRLNLFLRFDDEEDVEPFVYEFNLQFEEANGLKYLSIDANQLTDPIPPPKQPHSYHFVERKRGDHTLPETIAKTVYDEADGFGMNESKEDEDEGLFVKDPSTFTPPSPPQPKPLSLPIELSVEIEQAARVNSNAQTDESPSNTESETTPKPRSLFDRISGPQTFSSDFFSAPPAEPVAATEADPIPQMTSTAFSAAPISQQPTPSTAAPIQSQPPSLSRQFSFPALQQNPPPQDDVSGSQGLLKFHNPGAAQQSPSSAAAPQLAPQSAATSISPAITFTPPTAPAPTAQQPQTQIPSLNGFSPTKPQPTVTSLDVQPPPTFALNGPSSLVQQQTAPTITQNAISNRDNLAPTVNFQIPTPVVHEEPPRPGPRDSLKRVTEWVVLGDDGLIEQFTTYHAQNILLETFNQFLLEQKIQVEQAAERRARVEADEFRYRSLATKYGHLWRHQTHRLWLKRRGREARKARREMAESMKASKAAQSANIVKDFKASTTTRGRDSLESLLDATGILNGVHDSNEELQAIVHEGHQPSKRQRSDTSSSPRTSGTSRHKRGKSDNPFRRSLTSDPSYLSGGSRIHLMSNYSYEDSIRPQRSGVQTDYFRLKARGITTLPDGTPLANTAAMDFLHSKRSSDGIAKQPAQSRLPSTPKSTRPEVPQFWSEERKVAKDTDIEALKLRARTIMSEEKNRHKRKSMDDDEELFERAKRLREQMDEGARWFRREVERDTASRSVS